jgi:hypothetical protein
MLLVKAPVPVPSVVLLLAVVGPEDVFQHTPLAVTVDVPAEDTLPPQVVVVCIILLTSEVFTTGADKAGVVNIFSSPYEVPAELVAKART